VLVVPWITHCKKKTLLKWRKRSSTKKQASKWLSPYQHSNTNGSNYFLFYFGMAWWKSIQVQKSLLQ
jgi:hypothetical protein